MDKNWFEIKNPDELLSPALLFYPDRIQQNIDQMINVAGSPDRLRPHIKTYKCREIVAMQSKAGITKFKCATLAEAEMLGKCGVKDVLISYPLIGPAQVRFTQLIKQFPKTQFSTLIDHESQIEKWVRHEQPIHLFIDLDVGMHRTGIVPEKAAHLLSRLKNNHITFRGLHIYDGHIHDTDLETRKASVDQAFKPVDELIKAIDSNEMEVISGGSITFPIHAQFTGRQLSPGTTLLWDQGYSTKFPDLKFKFAAMVFSRVVSMPGDNRLCLDLGYKAIASEMSEPPAHFPQIPDAVISTFSEEHMVIETKHASEWTIGNVVYGIPWHICPTVALHEYAGIVSDKRVNEYWQIEARKRNY